MEESAMKNGTKTSMNNRTTKSDSASQRLQHRGHSSKFLLAAAAICALTVVSALTASAGSLYRPAALTESGVVIGFAKNGMNQFLGIPYAAPPVGNRRWKPSKPYGQFQGGVLQATQFGSECTQAGGGSEDCLFLNVYSPKG